MAPNTSHGGGSSSFADVGQPSRPPPTGTAGARVRALPFRATLVGVVRQGMVHPPPKTILLCSCEDTMHLDTAAVRSGCRKSEIATFRQLCRVELDQFRSAAKAEGSLTVGCMQEVPLFSDEAGERQRPLDFVNLR